MRLNSLVMQSTHPAWCIFTLRRVLAMKSGLFCEHQLDASTSEREVRPHEMIVAKAFPYICHKDCISWLALLLTPPTGIVYGRDAQGGVRGDILGHKGVPRVSATATTATTNARGLKGRFAWCHQETPGILLLLLVLLQWGERGFFLAAQGSPRASVSFPSIHPDPICYAMSSYMMQILRRHHVASHIFQSLHQLVSFRW